MNIMANVTDVEVDCVNNFFNVGVTVTGLAAGNSVFLKNNDGDLLEVSDNNILTNFSTQIGNSLDYLITFNTQPTTLNQTCSFTNANSGDLNGGDVEVTIECVTTQYDVNVTVIGLADTNSISFANGTDTATFTTNETQTISTLDDGSEFNVSISLPQPTTLNQTCSFTNANSSNIAGGNIEVTVNCVISQYNIGANVIDLDPDNFITLETNSQNLVFIENTSSLFATPLDDGTSYDVNVISQPSTPNQVCTVTGGNSGNNDGSGVITGSDVEVTVDCLEWA